MISELPGLGRNPFNVIRILSGCERQGNDYISASAECIRGMIGKQGLDSDGNVEWSVYTGSSGSPAGILNSHKTSSIYKPVTQKPVAVDSSTGQASLVPYLQSGSVLIQDSDDTDITSEFSANNTTGVITTSNGTYMGTTVYASFRYLLVDEGGIDETKGTGKVSIIRGVGEIETLLYDTGSPISRGDSLKSYNGVPSTRNGLSGSSIGTVIKPPTYSDPTLRFRINL